MMKRAFMLLGSLLLILVGCSQTEEAAKQSKSTGLAKDEYRNEAFKDLFPLHYESYMKNKKEEDTKYGGSVKRSKFEHDKEPYLPILFNGYGFATEYNEDRGHVYATEDVRNIKRITDKSVGSCLTCKSTAVPKLIEEMGDNYWGANFNQVIWPKAEAMGHSPIGCSDCHDPQTMDLRITRPSFIEAMKTRGVDVTKATKNEMRSYVCAQCHVEYYFEPSKSKVTFPWAKGFKPEEMYAYYEEIGKQQGFEKDWIHNVSGTPMLKAQHPEFETWIEGPHGKAGVSCADCHMPYERVDGKKKITSHYWTSPLKTIEQSCLTCHADKSKEWIKTRVEEIQTTHMEMLHKAEEVSVFAHYYVNKMITAKVDESKIKAAQEHIRKGQWYWDIVAAENSTGFHNPQGTMATLSKSIDESNQAILIATEELMKKGIDVDKLKKEIEERMEAVYNEADPFKKKDHAITDSFPGQTPPPPAKK
ncbi:nitrite reductase [Anoxybacillus gonensis]|uniref:nitrite reductase (cytochrome; ammonia-forming) n=1 Tax=Anoxybacillus gonensis TaxID=198467 RepID=A0AAW7TEY5_9BACL|nr:ammonia-forming cytochrome c nitrite reductase subunit c552 [Anoxybacillus gonensis]AXM89943.1 ammonia-forming cytochrome c nitrite reductase subunit c552 [Anoxybacillus ayderensis G10]MBW9218037.1 ammonia-forming cytochrome c nitrite reductase subunit c552 [Anoxybacillus sp. ST70]THD17305.1 ammonia-forming cytochrome c nitrite reductase subunit c552 [Anoxybacillus ayderensis]AKS38809.1 nitrite reductase [Anoxybacillus gonensis]KGP60084.1 nitrite reductase [Anoxybacillus gonensis]